jgi:hypothetical protein
MLFDGHDHLVLIADALAAAVLGIGLGAECRPSQAAESATLGPRMEMSETAVLAESPYPAQRPQAAPG